MHFEMSLIDMDRYLKGQVKWVLTNYCLLSLIDMDRYLKGQVKWVLTNYCLLSL